MAEESPRSDVGLLVGMAAAGGLGYLAYQHWYLPMRARQELEREIMLRQLQRGGSRQDALASLGSQACQVIGLKYGLPPPATADLCGTLGAVASGIVRKTPGLVISAGSDALKVLASPVTATVKAVGSVGRDVGRFFSKIF